jgi:hypothetical protein
MVYFPFLDFISGGSEEEKGIGLLWNIQDEGLEFLGLLKKEGSGCFRPDDEIRFFLCHPGRKLTVDF